MPRSPTRTASPGPGRPRKKREPVAQEPTPKPLLEHSEALLEQLRKLGRIQATVAEVASVLRCSEGALRSYFVEHPDAKEAHGGGRLEGMVALRRKQFELAESNPTIAIWLGRQYLAQTEKIEHIGDPDNPIRLAGQIEIVIVDPKATNA